MFKKKLICTDNDEDDDYEYIGNEKTVKSNISSTSSASIKDPIKDNSSSGLTSKDKQVKYLKIIHYKLYYRAYIYIVY